MTAGETFLIIAPRPDDHLWMVISDPAADPDRVVVCFLSWQAYNDQACVLEVGDHPFIKHPTCVQYDMSRVVSDARLEQMRRAGDIKMRNPLPPATLALIRVRAAFGDLSTDCYDVLKSRGFVP